MQNNHDLDALIDEALSSYTAAEPDPSLRARIMAQAVKAAPNRKHLWWFAPAAACVAALAIALLQHPTAHAPRSQPSSATSIASAPESSLVKAVPQPITRPHPPLTAQRTRRSTGPTLIRNASFPSPTPLTPQESILLKFAMEHPEQARQVLTATATRPIENAPLSIAPIHIAALSEMQQTQ